MKRFQFNYHCPPELIAQTPAEKRESSRLLVYQPNKRIADHQFTEILDVLNNIFKLKEQNKKLLLIANNSKVYPARVTVYRKTGAKCEVFVLEVGHKDSYSCLIKPRSKLKQGEILYLNSNGTKPVFEITDFINSKMKPLFVESMSEFLEKHGITPLPPYIKRDAETFANQKQHDLIRYQNVYAQNENLGSAAAPTAGFHFSQSILNQLPDYNIEIDYVTLHVGLGTFLPVKTEDISEHAMHEETYKIASTTVKKIFEYLKNDWPIVFIGTTSLRSTESFFRNVLNQSGQSEIKNEFTYQKALELCNKWHSTNLFLYPKHENDIIKPLIGNAIITNFHQPESSLLMLVSSIIGYSNFKIVYDHAIKQKYRFFSYGDSSLLLYES